MNGGAGVNVVYEWGAGVSVVYEWGAGGKCGL